MKRKKPMDRLTRDVLAAEAAGMSYGKYKALHPYTPEPEQEEAPLDDDRRELTCQKCGKIFVAYGHEVRRKYCSDECRRNAAYAMYRMRHPIPMVPCAICGAEFPGRGGRKYCGNACRMAASRANKAAWEERQNRIREEDTDD